MVVPKIIPPIGILGLDLKKKTPFKKKKKKKKKGFQDDGRMEH
jgi:hypothetical protein